MMDPRMAVGMPPNELIGTAQQGPQLASPFSAPPQAQQPQGPAQVPPHVKFMQNLMEAAKRLPDVDLKKTWHDGMKK